MQSSEHQTSDIKHQTSIPDRGHLSTEQRNPAAASLDALDTEAMLRLINDEDAKVAAAVRSAIPAIAKLIDAVVAGMKASAPGNGGRLIYFGAGTSGRLGVLDASECPPTFHVPPELVVGVIAGGDAALRKSSEGMEDDPEGPRAEIERLNVNPNDTVIAIAAGGTTPYAWGAIALAKQRGATTALIACVPHSQIKNQKSKIKNPDHLICLPVGPEVLTGSTRMKSGTATKLALNMISTGVMVKLGKTWGNLMVDLRATNAKLRDRAARILTSQTDLSRDEALALLDRAGGRVKPALVMARRNVDAAEAQRLLDGVDQQLRPILGDPR